LLRGLACQESGEGDEAERLYSQVLEVDPTCVDAAILLGLLYLEAKKFVNAELAFRRVTERVVSHSEAFLGLAHALREQGRYQESISAYRVSIGQQFSAQDGAEAQLGLAICYLYLANFDSALSCINSVLTKHPERDAAYVVRASIFAALGDHDSALKDYDAALNLTDKNMDAWVNRALSLKAMNRDHDAMTCLKNAITIDESNANAAVEYALELQKLGRMADADDVLHRAFKKNTNNPRLLIALALVAHKRQSLKEAEYFYGLAEKEASGSIEVYLGRGVLHAQQGRLMAAINDFMAAKRLDPDNRDVHFNLASVQSVMRDFSNAVTSFENALKIDGSHTPSLLGLSKIFIEIRQNNIARKILLKASQLDDKCWESRLQLGFLSRQEKNILEASKHYDSALRINPTAPFLIGEAFFTRLAMCEWSRWDESVAEIQKAVVDGKPVLMPFQALAIFDSAEIQLKCAQTFTESRHPEKFNWVRKENSSKRTNQKVKIAYFSSDFYEHATTYLLAEVLEAHNRGVFEVVGYSFGSSPVDLMTSRMTKCFDQFIDVSLWSDDAIVTHCRDQGIDIAIDLKGHTFGARPNIFANRCAPVQVNYLGYPGTMGASYIDYILVDATLWTSAESTSYTETPIILPHCYQPNCALTALNMPAVTRADVGLPDGCVVFSSFNNNYKITPAIFDAWMTILRRIPGSVLWLLATNAECKVNLRREAERRGVAGNRLVFADFQSHDEHLARLKLADLFLDTYPCSAHTTASDSLRVGVPVLTLKGHTFASRVATSLLTDLRLPEMITNSIDEYVETAVRVAQTPTSLRRIREKVARSLETSRLFKPQEYVRTYEQALIEALQLRRATLPSHSLTVVGA